MVAPDPCEWLGRREGGKEEMGAKIDMNTADTRHFVDPQLAVSTQHVS